MPGWGLLVRLGFQTDRQTSVLPTRHCGVIRVPGELLPGTQRTSLRQDLPQGAQDLWVSCQSRPLSRRDKKPRSGTVPSSLDYVTRGMWNYFNSLKQMSVTLRQICHCLGSSMCGRGLETEAESHDSEQRLVSFKVMPVEMYVEISWQEGVPFGLIQ